MSVRANKSHHVSVYGEFGDLVGDIPETTPSLLLFLELLDSSQTLDRSGR